MVESLLSVKNLHKRFDEFVAVRDVSLELEASGSLGIVGESGSGKTTLARMIVGLTTPSSGTITFAGDDRTRPARRSKERRARGREIQIVFQDPYGSLDPRQSIGDCLDEVLRLHHGAMEAEARQARVSELLDLVGLDARRSRSLPRSLSGGQRQRVAIARALAAEPRLLVLDEPVSALDVSIQAQILNLLADIRDETGLAYLLISHDLAVVRQVSEQIVVMESGSVVERGGTAAVLDDPQHAYTKLLRNMVPGPGWRPQRRPRRAPPAPPPETKTT